MKLQNSQFHFIGVGGIGMSALAELLNNMGAQVSGSDMRSNDQTQHLQNIGVRVHKGHSESHVAEADVVVYSSAVKANNVEMLAAKERDIPRIPRAEALAEIMNLKRGLAIGGTHGKTTTTSMVASIFIHAKKQPTIAVGGRLDLIKSTALLGSGEWMIAEADESDGSFSRLNHELCVITNIDDDHIDHYKSMANLKRAFYDFALKVPFYGSAVVCGDDENIRETFKDFPKKIAFYGFDQANDFYMTGNNGNYEVFSQEEGLVGTMHLQFPGRHNALNALAAAVVSYQAGISWKDCFSGLTEFEGVDRRFQLRGTIGQTVVYDDYGHHPTEVRAVLQAMMERFPDKKIKVLFQPHRYTRTQACWQEFADSFGGVDYVHLLDIYEAGERPLEGVNSQLLAKEITSKNADYVGTFEEAAKAILSSTEEQVLVCLGAGDVYKFYDYLRERI